MVRRRLIIEAGEAGQLLVQLDAGTLTLRGSPKHPEAILQPLRVARLYFELEVEGEPTAAVRGPGQAARRPLPLGEVFQLGTCQLRVEGEDEPAAPPVTEEDVQPAHHDTEEGPEPEDGGASESPAPVAGQRKRLVVIDGADQGKRFRLPLEGTIALGKSSKHADIVLHDLYVGRLHCQLEINGDEVVVVHQGGSGGTMIGGRRIDRQAMRLGDILRVGNSHFRLELVPPGEEDVDPEVIPGHREGTEEEEAFQVSEKETETAEKEAAAAGEDAGAGLEIFQEEGAKGEDIPEAARQLQRLRDEVERLTGQVLGHFRVGPVLGRGRHGLVFRAEDLKTRQTVALKVLSPLFPQTEAELRHFAQTLKSVLPLRHANLVAIHGVGKTGMYTWIVRDYVEGESVADLLRRLPVGQRLDWRIACRVAVHVAGALDFARSQHLHHGQVCPANILLRRGSGVALLADLMLTPALQGSRLGQARLSYRFPGELCFLSPEQTQRADLVDDAADVYALGAVVYALLTGRPPFLGDTAANVLEQILGPARPTRPGAIHSAIPAPLEKMVMRMLAKNPDDRYPTVAALLADLKHVAEKERLEV